MVGYGTPKNDELVIDNSKMDVYTTTGDSVKVDLSQLNVAKDNYVLLKGNVDSDPIAVKFAKNDAKLKPTVTYTNDTANVTFANNGKESKIDPKDENIDIYGNSLLDTRLISSTEDPETGKRINKYEYKYDDLLQKGATLYAQTKIVGDGELVKSNEEYKSVKNGTVKDIKVYTGSVRTKQADGTYKEEASDILLPSKAVKVSIAKRANAPKLKADYVKNTITVPQGQKRELAYEGDEEEGTFVVPGEWTDVRQKETATLGSTKKIIEVRTAQKNEKKPASKTGFIQVPALETTVSGCAVTANVKSGGSIDGANVIAVSGGATVVEITADDKLNAGTKGKLVVDVKDPTYGYDVALVSQETITKGVDKEIDGKTNKFTAVKKSSKKNISVDTSKNGKYVFVRRSGDKKTLQFAGKWTFVGTIKGTDVPTGLDATESGGNGSETSTPLVLSQAENKTTIGNSGVVNLTLTGAEGNITWKVEAKKSDSTPIDVTDTNTGFTLSNESKTGVTVTAGQYAGMNNGGVVTVTATETGKTPATYNINITN
jgi:hypothetical protein